MTAFNQHAFTNLIIRASAGTGKTFQLSNRFLGLLFDGAAADQVLASTFTRKAAGEILDRVLLRLAGAATDEAQRRELAAFIESNADLSRERCLELLERLTRNLHHMRVGTLDSFFAQIARAYCLELGLSPRWTIVDELDDSRLRDEAVEAVLQQGRTQDLIELMHLLTKGEVTRSVAETIRNTVSDLYGLFQETTSAAWSSLQRSKLMTDGEVAELLDDLRGVEMPGKRFAGARDKDVDRAAAGDWDSFIGGGLAAKVLDETCEYYKKPIPDAAVAVYRPLLAHARGVLVARLASQNEATYELLAKFDVEYQRLKRQRGALRFDDITRRLAAAAELGDVDRLAFRLDARCNHLLLDEFQDTAPPQWQVVRPFAQRVTAPGDNNSFFCVGDVKQAIYGWRGGMAEIFDAIDAQLTDLQHDQLNKSYRSAPAVIDTVNTIFSGLSSHPNLERLEDAVRRWSDGFEPHTTNLVGQSGYACLVTAPDATPLLEYAASRVAEIVAAAPGQSVGVLVRKNSAIAELIYYLRGLGVHASEEGGNPLTDSAAILAVLSLLRLADHPGDTVARFHIAHSPLSPLAEIADHRDDVAAARAAQRVRKSLVERGYGATIYEWARALAPHCNRRELSRLQQLVAAAYAYEPAATLRSDDFRALIENQRVSDPAAADVRVMTIHQAKGLEFDVVVLPELDAQLSGQPDTFVVGRADPTAPPERVCRYVGRETQTLLPVAFQEMFAAATDRSIAEALCVLYVAVTRAARALHMIIAPAKANERNLPKTYAGLLRATLAKNSPAAPESTLYQHGVANWFTRSESDRQADDTAQNTATQQQPLRVQLAPSTAARHRGLNRTSPSGLEGGARIKIASVLRGEQTGALDRGTLIHAWFEQIDWLDDGRPTDDSLRAAATQVLETTTGVDGFLADFRDMLDRDEIARCLRRAFYKSPSNCGFDAAANAEWQQAPVELQVQNERRFAVRDGDGILTGAIDRLVLVKQGGRTIAADIIDFKTDKIDNVNPLDEKVEFYRPQIAAYRRAVAKMTRLPAGRIAARLLFVGAGIARQV